jgi:hypothetical protein
MISITRNILAVASAVAVCCVSGGAQAALQTMTIPLDVYASAVAPAGENLATVTITDLLGGGVSVDVSLDKAIYFASTGGPHITFAFNLDKTITFSDLTFTNPSKSDFTFVTNKNAGNTFGTFSAGIEGTWSGTSNHFAGPLDFTVAGVSVANFVVNYKDYWAIADVLGSKGTGEVGGQVAFLGPVVPEPATWAMMLLGFGGLGFAGYRKAKRNAVSEA